MSKRYWWPSSLPAQQMLISNFDAKISSYSTTLGMTEPEVLAARELCAAFTNALSYAEQSKATMQAVTQWREIVFTGEPKGENAPLPPKFAMPGDVDFTRGVVKQFQELRDRILLMKGYNNAIGEDLGLIGPEETPLNPDIARPQLKTSTNEGYVINISGSLRGMDAMRVEYAPKGGTFKTVAYLTSTPGGFKVTPETPGKPESGYVRAVFVKKNQDFGQFSADYPVTITD